MLKDFVRTKIKNSELFCNIQCSVWHWILDMSEGETWNNMGAILSKNAEDIIDWIYEQCGRFKENRTYMETYTNNKKMTVKIPRLYYEKRGLGKLTLIEFTEKEKYAETVDNLIKVYFYEWRTK